MVRSPKLALPQYARINPNLENLMILKVLNGLNGFFLAIWRGFRYMSMTYEGRPMILVILNGFS